jgi:hypothetical protein
MLGYVSGHASQRGRSGPAAPRTPPALLAPVRDAAEADRAIAQGADLIDATGLPEPALAAIRARHSAARLWTGSPTAVDADSVAGEAGDSPAAAAAAAAISTWLGATVIRTRHVAPARRAIDMTLSISGDRLPELTTRGLA